MLRIKKKVLISSLVAIVTVFIVAIFYLNYCLVSELKEVGNIENSVIMAIEIRYGATLISIFLLLLVLSIYLVVSYLRTETETDHLTNLFSWKKLHIDLHRYMRKEKEFILCYIDFIEFKKLNDSRGHDFGDSVLVNFACSVSKLPSNFSCYRIHGDEFIVIIRNCKNAEDAVKKIIASYDQTVVINGEKLKLGFNIGVSFYPKNGTTAEKIIKEADTAMYEAKKQKKDYCICR